MLPGSPNASVVMPEPELSASGVHLHRLIGLEQVWGSGGRGGESEAAWGPARLPSEPASEPRGEPPSCLLLGIRCDLRVGGRASIPRGEVFFPRALGESPQTP